MNVHNQNLVTEDAGPCASEKERWPKESRPEVSDFNRAAGASLINSPVSIVGESDKSAKHLATIRAEFTLAGFAVREVEIGGWFVSNETVTFYCAAVADLEVILSGVAK